MRVKLNWLNELVDLSDLTTKEIVDTLSLHSTEIESVERVVSGTNLVIGHVLTCVDHPDSDHLHITTVDVGAETLQIVCGAPNIKAGLDVIVALVGAELPGGLKIKKAKVRGVESNGMICSLAELGMEKKYIDEEYADGIYYFTRDVKPGSDALAELGFDDDVLELGLTPNRGDLMSMLGVGYEVSAVFNRPLFIPTAKAEECDCLNKDLIDVRVETDKCLTYYAKVIKDVKIKKSPDWLISRLIAFGIRPINNAVDITNYILALFGQPLHAFDYKLLGKKVLVRNAKENEELITLDGIKRSLLPTDIVITDGKKPVALAGVMGGDNTAINDDTKDIVLEAAVFDPISIRKTYTRLDLRSESSVRFEKGVDLNRTKYALDYACFLFQELCDAKIASGDVVDGITRVEPKEIKVNSTYVSNYLGINISSDNIVDIMERLGFDANSDKDEILIRVPNRRPDITIKQDIIEEVGRIHGYAELPVTLPSTPLAGRLTNYQKRRRELKHALTYRGLVESINYSLRENNNEFTYLFEEGDKDIELLMPISNERKILRRNLVPSMLDNVNYAFNRKINDVAIFEIGKVYNYNNGSYHEKEHLAIALAGSITSTLWKGENETVDFYLLKGIIDSAFSTIGVKFTYLPIDKEVKEMHPLRTAKIMWNEKTVGYVGELHPKYAQDKELKGVYVAEIDVHEILGVVEATKQYTPITKVPSVERDLALVCKKDVLAYDIIKTIKDVDKKLISDVILFDLYEGEKIASDLKSIALRVIFTSNETLTDDLVNNKINKILKTLEKNLAVTLRA